MNNAKLKNLLSNFEKKFNNKNYIDYFSAKEYICNLLKIDVDDKYIEKYLFEKGYRCIQKLEKNNNKNSSPILHSEGELITENNSDYASEFSDKTELDNIFNINEESDSKCSYDSDKSMDQILDLELKMNYNKQKNVRIYNSNSTSKTKTSIYSFNDNKRILEEYTKNKSIDILELLLEINKKLIYKEAQYYSRYLGGHCLSQEDLVQEGYLGLIKAINKYNPSLGYEFSTYALYWIKQSITRAICDKENIVRIPVHAIELIFRIRKCESNLLRLKGYISPDDVCEEIGISINRYLKLKAVEHKFFSVASLDMPVGEDNDNILIDLIPDEYSHDAVFDSVVENDLRYKLNIVLDTLTTREKKVLCLRFGLEDGIPRTLEDIGKYFNVTRERIRQIEVKALRKLRHPSRSKIIKDFL